MAAGWLAQQAADAWDHSGQVAVLARNLLEWLLAPMRGFALAQQRAEASLNRGFHLIAHYSCFLLYRLGVISRTFFSVKLPAKKPYSCFGPETAVAQIDIQNNDQRPQYQ